ncbi:tumor necrosis factor receptor superfamily member 9a isoform X2 [Pungitius pungitius]|uniref:tumor necrosis factor receptor superfamily member 9a isoform X2 n=1 Tax=Pungitius pungitius TaxID=134920 RepID=UPI002E0FFE0D
MDTSELFPRPGGLCSVGQTHLGCMNLTRTGSGFCCNGCHPGYRLFKVCGPLPEELCTPCEPGTFSGNPKSNRCARCTQCVGAQVYVQACTATTDTKCGCKEKLTCGDSQCSYCVDKCDKGHEPTNERSCRPCKNGTFNDQVHKKCKPWRTKCPNPDEHIVAQGNALTDTRCAVTLGSNRPDPTEEAWPFVLSVVISVVLTSFVIMMLIIIISSRSRMMAKKRKEEEVVEKEKTIPGTLIIDSPTDDPRTLIAIECSFHEAEQEQGSSSESLASDDSSGRLIG